MTNLERASLMADRLAATVDRIDRLYVGIIPFVLIQLAALVVLWFAPGLATWLPHRLYGP